MTQLNLGNYGIEKTEDGNYESGKSSTWLKAEDVGKIGTDYTTTIKGVREYEFKEEMKILVDVEYKDEESTLVLNKTNLLNLLDAFGDDTDKWKGKQVTLKVERTTFNGKTVPCIRVYG